MSFRRLRMLRCSMPWGAPDLLAFKAAYFCYFASLSAVHPFLSLLLTERGLSARLIGTLLLLKPLAGLVGGAAVCGFADQHQCHRAALLVSVIASAVTIQCLWWTTGEFVHVMLLFLAIGFFSTPISSIVDSLCARCIEDTKSYATYSQIRLWGAVGWGTFAAVASILVDRMSSWTPAFVIHGFFSVGTLFACNNLARNATFRRDHGGDTQREHVERPFWDKIKLLKGTQGALTFIQLCFWFGTTTGAIEGFLFPFLATMSGASERLYGISLSVTCVSESLVFWRASEILGWFENGIGVVNVCFLAFAVRLVAYTTLKIGDLNAWTVLLVEPLHGLTFALTWAWLINEAKNFGSACHLESFCVAIGTASMFNVGYSVGGFVAGMMFSIAPTLAFIPSLGLLAVGWFTQGREYRATTGPRLKTKLSGILNANVEDDGV